MKHRGESVIHARSSHAGRSSHGARFWDDVESEIEALDWRDLAEFLAADSGPFEPCAEFHEELRQELLSFVHRRRE